MTPVTLLLVAIGGGVGSVGRFLLDSIVKARTGAFPYGTLLINVSGSLLLGLVTGFGEAGALPGWVVSVVGTGMIGGYTTFSTASVETVQLFRAGRTMAGAINGLGMLVVSVGAAALGLFIGRIS